MGCLEEGVVTLEEIQTPDEPRFQKGPVVIIECIQEIPCNPCVDSCPHGAISIRPTLNDLPRVDFDKCIGCGLCIAHCPGLAIFLVDHTFEKKRALVGIPYEFVPLPKIGETVEVFNRAGRPCGKGEIIRIRNAQSQDRTPVVYLAVSKRLAMTVRHFKRISDASAKK